MEFHIKKSRFKESKCADRGHSLNRDFTVDLMSLTSAAGQKLSSHSPNGHVPVIFPRMLLNKFKPKLFGEQHESVHRPFRLMSLIAAVAKILVGRRVGLLLLCGRHRRRHLIGLDHPVDQGRRGDWPGQRRRARVAGKVLVELEPAESVAEIRSADGLRVIRGQANVAQGQGLARDAVLLDGEPGMRAAPTCNK